MHFGWWRRTSRMCRSWSPALARRDPRLSACSSGRVRPRSSGLTAPVRCTTHRTDRRPCGGGWWRTPTPRSAPGPSRRCWWALTCSSASPLRTSWTATILPAWRSEPWSSASPTLSTRWIPWRPSATPQWWRRGEVTSPTKSTTCSPSPASSAACWTVRCATSPTRCCPPPPTPLRTRSIPTSSTRATSSRASSMPRSRQPSPLPYGKSAAQPESWGRHTKLLECRRRQLDCLPPCDGPHPEPERAEMDRLVGEPIEHAPEAVLLRPIRVFPHKATHLEQVGRSFLHLWPCAERRTSYGAPRTASAALCGKTNPVRAPRTASAALCEKTNPVRGTAYRTCGLVRKDEPRTGTAYRICGLVRKDEPRTGHRVPHLWPCAERRTPYGAPRTASAALCGKTKPARLTARN